MGLTALMGGPGSSGPTEEMDPIVGGGGIGGFDRNPVTPAAAAEQAASEAAGSNDAVSDAETATQFTGDEVRAMIEAKKTVNQNPDDFDRASAAAYGAAQIAGTAGISQQGHNEVRAFVEDGSTGDLAMETDPGGGSGGSSATGSGESDGSGWRTLKVRGSGQAASYRIQVSGRIQGKNNLNASDSAGGKTAEGRVSTYQDIYRFQGRLTDVSLDGPAEVLVDGQRVDPESVGGPTAAGLASSLPVSPLVLVAVLGGLALLLGGGGDG